MDKETETTNLGNKESPEEGAPEREVDLERAERFYTRLRKRITDWFERRGKTVGKVGSYVLLLPDFLALIIRLIRDPRVSRAAKIELMAVLAYIVTPVDLIPDFLFPFGLIDDTVAAAFALNRTAHLMQGAGAEILEEHWEGEGSVLKAIQGVINAADDLVNGRILGMLRRRFGGGGKE